MRFFEVNLKLHGDRQMLTKDVWSNPPAVGEHCMLVTMVEDQPPFAREVVVRTVEDHGDIFIVKFNDLGGPDYHFRSDGEKSDAEKLKIATEELRFLADYWDSGDARDRAAEVLKEMGVAVDEEAISSVKLDEESRYATMKPSRSLRGHSD